MKRRSFTLLLILVAVSSSNAGDQPRKEANEILKKASTLETFKIHEHPRYRHEVHFSLLQPGTTAVQGDYLLEVVSPSFWREEVNFDNYRLRRVGVRNRTWTQTTHDFTPLVVEEIEIALSTSGLRLGQDHVVNRVYDREIDGAKDRCIEFDTIRRNDKMQNQVCVQKASGYITYARHGGTDVTFSDFFHFGSTVKPRRITITLPDKARIIAESTYNDIGQFDPADFKPIDGADVSELCHDSSGAVAVFAPDPVYPQTPELAAYKGKITGVVKVGQDGSVLNVAIVDSLQPVLDAAALEAVKKWKFKPGTCNGKPVNSVTHFSVTYQ